MALFEAEKAAAMERSTLASLKARFRKAQKSLFIDDPLKKVVMTTPKESLLLCFLKSWWCSKMPSTDLPPWWKARRAHFLLRL